MAVRRVLAQADVGDHDQVGVGLLERPDRHLHDALRIVGAGAGLVLGGRDAEQDHGADPGRLELGRLGDQLGDREALDPGHRGHRLAHPLAGDDEQGLHEVARRELRLAHELAQGLRSPQPPHAGGGKAHGGDSRDGSVAADANRQRTSSWDARASGAAPAAPAAPVGARARIARWRIGRPSAGAGSVEAARDRVERRVEGEQRPDHLDHVEQGGADRAGLDQGDERDRQRDHEGEQRAGADLAGGCPDRRAEGGEGGAARHDRRCEQREAAPVDVDEQRQAGRASGASPAIDSATPSPTFSARSAVRPTSPRVSRGKAFSSRSSASEPATSSTVTNIRVTVSATAIANESRLGGEPETTSFSTSIGWAIVPRSGLARLRFWRASRENWITRSSGSANGLPAGSSGAQRLEDALGVLEARAR